jgi:hypothetical protein
MVPAGGHQLARQVVQEVVAKAVHLVPNLARMEPQTLAAAVVVQLIVGRLPLLQ